VEEPRAVLGRCQLPGQLQQLGGGVRGASTARVPACLLQCLGHLQIWSAGREGEVPSPLLQVDDQVRQAAMRASPAMGVAAA
jgi:hypothetical protein